MWSCELLSESHSTGAGNLLTKSKRSSTLWGHQIADVAAIGPASGRQHQIASLSQQSRV
jgi:hypothetical protein